MFWYPIKQKERGDKLFDVAKKYVYLWQHDENTSRVESNVNAVFKVHNPIFNREEEHGKRAYIAKGGLKFQYSAFMKSSHFKQFVNEIMIDDKKNLFFTARNKAPSISMETFRLSLCGCIGNPTTQSCVDIRQDKVFLSGVAIENFIYNERLKFERLGDDVGENNGEEATDVDGPDNVSFYDKLKNCSCEACTKLGPESPWVSIFRRKVDTNVDARLVRKCLCQREARPDLQLENEEEPPKFYKWLCASGKCSNCGIDALPWDCETLSQCNTEIDVQVWDEGERGGKQTQLEIMDKVLPVNAIVSMLKSDLEVYINHFVDLQFFKRMKNLDVEKQPNSTLLIFTDFAAMMDYRANKTLCGHQDNHGVLQIFYVLSDPRNIEIPDDDGEIQSKRFRDCEIYYVFGGTEDAGRKHDWVFHNASLEYIINKEVEKSKEKNKAIDSVRIYTDNCGSQYKCRQNFFNLSKLPSLNENLVIAEHLYAPVYGFKGPWDTAGKVAKFLAKRLEKEESGRIRNAFAHFEAMKHYLDSTDKVDWAHLESTADKVLLGATAFTATKRHSLYATDHEDEFEKLKEKELPVIFTNRKVREVIEDTEAYPDSGSFYHAIGCGKNERDGKMKIEFREKFCFCDRCRTNSPVPNIGEGCRNKDFIGKISKFDRNDSTVKNDDMMQKLLSMEEIPTPQQLDKVFKLPELKTIAKILGVRVSKDIKRSDGKKAAPMKSDVSNYLVEHKFKKAESWFQVKETLRENWAKMKN